MRAGRGPRAPRFRSLSATPLPLLWVLHLLETTPRAAGIASRAGVAASCFPELRADRPASEQADRPAPATHPGPGPAGHPGAGGLGQEVKVYAGPFSSAIDLAGFFLGGGAGIRCVFFT